MTTFDWPTVEPPPTLPPTVVLNRLRTLLDWLTDHAHALPDGWAVWDCGTDPARTGSTRPTLTWQTYTEEDAAHVIATLTDLHGPASTTTQVGRGLVTEWAWKGERPELAVWHTPVWGQPAAHERGAA